MTDRIIIHAKRFWRVREGQEPEQTVRRIGGEHGAGYAGAIAVAVKYGRGDD